MIMRTGNIIDNSFLENSCFFHATHEAIEKPNCLSHPLLLVLLCWLTPVWSCNFTPKTELEKVYCEVQDRGEGGGLPDIFEFRKNPPKTQALLLRKPAATLGIKLPQSKSPVRNVPSEPLTPPIKPEKNLAVLTPPRLPVAQSNGLASCQLNNSQIQCGYAHFVLLTNQQISQLEKSALSEFNKLIIPAKSSALYRDYSVQSYLSDVYPTYLEKMIKIGLGDTTMSFTKFVATYQDIVAQGEDFSARFNKMYELLKTERKSNAIKARYNNNFPDNISQCMQVTSLLIACDNVSQNWLYQKSG